MWLKFYFLGMSWQYSFAYTNTSRFMLVLSTVEHNCVLCSTVDKTNIVYKTKRG